MAVPFGSFSFSKGEIAPGLFGRVDQAAFHSAATTFRNMFANFKGGAYSRAGGAFVGFSRQTGRSFPPRLVTFQFSILQGLALEFGNFYMRVVSNGAFVTEPPVPITGVTNANPAVISVTASAGASATPITAGVIQSYAPGEEISLAGGTFTAPAVLQVDATQLISLTPTGSAAGYVPADTIVPAGGTQSTPAQLTVVTTRLVSATISVAGSGGADGMATVTGTTGTGTKFQAAVTITGGAITAVLSITVGGAYTVNPTSLTNEPVTGAGLSGAQLNVGMGVGTILITGAGIFTANPAGGTFTQTSSSGGGTGATFALALMAPEAVSFITPGIYTVLPANPVAQLGTTGIGFGATFNVTWGASAAFADGDWVAISGIDGTTELNGNTYVLQSVSSTSAELFDVYGNPVDSTTFGAYISGGTAARIFTLDTPWAEEDLDWLKWTQSADVMSICCVNQASLVEYPPYDLGRINDAEWSLTQTTFAAGIAPPTNITAGATVGANPATSPPILPAAYAYVVTAIAQNTGEESIASAIANITNGVDIAATAGSNIVDWNPVSGAALYNVYRAPVSFNTDSGNPLQALPVPAGAQFSFVGFSYGTQFVDTNITADGAQVPPLHKNPFARGVILSVTVESFGSGITTITPTVNTSTGSGAIFQTVVIGGFLTAVIVLDGGENYAPTDTISFGGGSGENAVGDIAFTLNPGNGDTITLGGQVWTFVTSSPGAQETQIQGSLTATLAQLVADLAVSTNGVIQQCSYFATSTELQIHYGVPGTVGNVFTLAASAGTPSGPSLSGGGTSTEPQGFLNIGPQSGTYPGVVSYYQQRRVYAGSLNNPDTYEMSQPGLFKDFDHRVPTIDTDSITGNPWSLQVNGIQWFLMMPGGLLTFTGEQLWQLTGAGGSGLTPVAITPTDQQAQPQAFNGISATLPPIQVGYDVLFADAVGSYVYDVSYQYWLNIYTGNDITVFSSHLFDGFTVRQWAWARQPYKLVWAVRDDGAMLSLTFDKEQEVIGWTRHDTQGLFKSVCTVIEPPVNAPYFAVERFLALAGSTSGISYNGTWDPALIDAPLVLSAGNTVATLPASMTPSRGQTRSTPSFTLSAKPTFLQFNLTAVPASSGIILGICNAAFNIDEAPGVDFNSIGVVVPGALSGGLIALGDVSIGTAAELSQGDICVIAVTTTTIWVSNDGGVTWNGGTGTGGNPFTMTGGYSIAGLLPGPYFAVFNMVSSAGDLTNLTIAEFVQPITPGNAYTIERMDNRLWPSVEDCWCVDCGLELPHTFPPAVLTMTSATGVGSIIGVTGLIGGSGYSSLTTAAVVDDNGDGPGTGAVATITVVAGAIASVTFSGGNQGTGYTFPAIVFNDPSGEGSGASATAVLFNAAGFSASVPVFSGGDVGKIIRAGGGIAVVIEFINSQNVEVDIQSPVLRVIPNSAGIPLPQKAGSWSMDTPVTVISGLSHLTGLLVTGLADGNVITPRQVGPNGTITLDQPATQVIVGLGFQAQLQSPYLAEVAVQGQRKRIAEVTARLEASRGIKIGSNQPDASTLSPAPLTVPWNNMAIAPDLATPPYGSTTPPLYTGDVRIPIHGGYAKPGQVALQQDNPLPMNVLALIAEDELGDQPQGGKPAAKEPQQQRRAFAFQPAGPTAPPYA